ncbi:hypothetical protein PV10_01833 [Exophiala mesophila]|uniref:Uncharacterized protein n=1 Tax=Exophiala mesophila TaxID=212818 RepID=A0A0D2AGU5_EXOME|nr:uncharacterized protein PV10_01833 [Exophiala mesophila]KIV98153.1 hypothetical protein PV10_01833 [Exophiala mesophila]
MLAISAATSTAVPSRLDLASSPSTPIPSGVSHCVLKHMTSKRPKLSLQTSDIPPTYVAQTGGRSASRSAVEATPTGLNTFTNAFDLSYRPSPSTTLPSPVNSSRRNLTQSSGPYSVNLPHNVHPILKNSPVAWAIRRSSLAGGGDSPRIGNRRVFFPAPKRVSFRTVLEEEIVTKDYVVRHADLTSSEDETSWSESEEDLPRTPQIPSPETLDRRVRVDEVSPRGRRKRTAANGAQMERDSTIEQAETSTMMTTSGTWKRSRRKKRRWEWTVPAPPKLPKVADETQPDAVDTNNDHDDYDEPSRSDSKMSQSVGSKDTDQEVDN